MVGFCLLAEVEVRNTVLAAAELRLGRHIMMVVTLPR